MNSVTLQSVEALRFKVLNFKVLNRASAALDPGAQGELQTILRRILK